MIKYLVLAILLILILKTSFNTSTFWHNQFVQRNIPLKCGIIKDIKTLTHIDTKLPNGFQWKNVNINSDIDEIYEFLSKNYLPEQVISKEHLLKNMNFNPFATYCIVSQSVIIGTIFSKILKVRVYGITYNCAYVDYGCIAKEHRNKNLFPKLISKILESAKNCGIQFLFHKKDYKPLDHKYFAKHSYYIAEIQKKTLDPKIKLGELKLFDQIFAFYRQLQDKYVFYQILNEDEFKQIFENALYAEKDGKIIGLINYEITEYRKYGKIPEITFFYCSTNENEVFNHLLKYFKEYKHIVITDVNGHNLHKKHGFVKTFDSYLHFYNFQVSKEIPPNKIVFH